MRFLRACWQRLRFALTGRFLCDTCRLDYGSVCRRRERPNARVCPDYQGRQP